MSRAAPLWTAAGLALGPAAALGLGRFAYALLLPAMRADLHWSYAEAGSMNTANALGYLAGALLTPWVAAALGARRSFLAGIAVTVLALPATAISGDFGYLLALRLLAGLSGALALICGAALASQVASEAGARPALVLAVYFSGPGQGVVLSSLGIPYLLELGGGNAWRLGWLALGALGALGSMLAVRAALHAGEPPRRAPVGAARPRLAPLLPTFVAYTLFGMGYIGYMTFVVAFLQDRGAGTGEVSLFWALLGLASVLAVPGWGAVLTRARAGRGMSAVLGVVSVGALLPLLPGGFGVELLSALVFGGAFLGMVTAVTAVARRALPPHAWAGAIAALTVAFSLGQCVGPLFAGSVADTAAGVASGLAFSAGALVLGAVVAALQRDHVHRG